MALSNTKLDANIIITKQGIFGFGLSHNNNLDFMTIVVLAVMGIIIKLFFPERYSRLGNTGPATSTIWGYGLTATAISIMLFMGIYVTKNIFETKGNFFEMLFCSTFLKSRIVKTLETLEKSKFDFSNEVLLFLTFNI
jgi:hypothetical protein